jgi:hypothetical protein
MGTSLHLAVIVFVVGLMVSTVNRRVIKQGCMHLATPILIFIFGSIIAHSKGTYGEWKLVAITSFVAFITAFLAECCIESFRLKLSKHVMNR